MIKHEEIRKGNFVLHKGNPKEVFYATHTGVSFLIGYDWKDNALTQNYLYRGIDPIPLTGEILEKCGFDKSGMYYVKSQVYIWDTCVTNESGFEYKYNYTAMPINYIHQLQNLYFSLTGQELTINL